MSKLKGVSKRRLEMTTTTGDHDQRPDKSGLSSFFPFSNVECSPNHLNIISYWRVSSPLSHLFKATCQIRKTTISKFLELHYGDKFYPFVLSANKKIISGTKFKDGLRSFLFHHQIVISVEISHFVSIKTIE